MTLERSIQRAPMGSPLVTTVVCTTMFAIGLGVAFVTMASDEPEVSHAVAAPIVLPVSVPVTVTLAPPAVVTSVAATEPNVPPPVRPHALAPVLDAACVDAGYAEADHPECAWDDGFPAISGDGKTIVSKHTPDDGGRGYPGLTLEFIDVATSHVTRRVKILDPNEYDEERHGHRAKVARRTAAANQQIEAGHFRTLVPIADAADSFAASPSPLRAEVTGESIRVIDPNTTTVVWQARFSAKAAYPNLKHNPDEDMCGTVETSEVRTWWDEPTRTIVAGVSYAFGPSCMCGGESKTYVRHARPASVVERSTQP